MSEQNILNIEPVKFNVRETLRPVPCILDEDTPLLQLSELRQDDWTLRDAYEGVQVFGASGSGKTSGSGKALAHAFLRGGMGGIVLCAKPDEADNWLAYAKQTGRSDDIIRFSPEGNDGFNFLEYEMYRAPDAADIMVTNAVNLLMNVLDVAARSSSLSTPAAGDAFWIKSAKMLLGYAIQLLFATYGRIQLTEVIELIESAPTSRAQMRDEGWQKSSFFAATLRDFYESGGGKFPPEIEDAARLKQFWLHNFPNMAEKTRSNIITTLASDLDPLLQGRMRRLFSGRSTLVPEFTHDGAIILLDFPVRKWGDAGILAQQIFKYAWQRATERRTVTKNTRPVFLFADECQFFLSAYDMEFQSTARSSRACTVMMTQNLPLFYSRIGGNLPEHTVNALMGNLRTKIFHTNGDRTTNEWAAKMVGKATFWRETHGSNSGWSSGTSEGINEGKNSGWSGTMSGGGGQLSWSSGESGGHGSGWSKSTNEGRSGGCSQSVSEQRDYAVEPEDFSRDLKSGGRRNRYLVTGVIMQAGRTFRRNGKHWMQIAFEQRT